MLTVNYFVFVVVLAESMLQQREQKEMRAIRKTAEAAREDYEGIPI